jgi:hypothetical protein
MIYEVNWVEERNPTFNRIISDPTHAAVVESLGRIVDPSRLTFKQERILAFLEKEYGL